MKSETKQRLLVMAKNDLNNARDNLHRARNASRFSNPDATYGSSGQSLNSIIESYEDWKSKALETIKELEDE